MIQMKTILFQGDSITDAMRWKDGEEYMGSGYATMTAGKIGMNYPGKYRILNRGISGNRSCDLYARVKSDIINLKPDILTILIGVNDTWHELEVQNGVCVERYEDFLNMIVDDVKAALPKIKIILLEPFVMAGTGNAPYYDAFEEDVKKRQAVSKKVAEEHGLPYVFLQEKLEALAAKCSMDYVLYDGVHPSFAGHAVISEALYETLKEYL